MTTAPSPTTAAPSPRARRTASPTERPTSGAGRPPRPRPGWHPQRVADVTSVIRLAASAVLAAGGLVLLPATSQAAACESGGVTVVVDYSRSGGNGTETTCVVAGGGDTASELFGAAGHELTRVQRQPGAVCRVDGLRTQDACVNMPPADAFWGLFWSDGDGGWVFSRRGSTVSTCPKAVPSPGRGRTVAATTTPGHHRPASRSSRTTGPAPRRREAAPRARVGGPRSRGRLRRRPRRRRAPLPTPTRAQRPRPRATARRNGPSVTGGARTTRRTSSGRGRRRRSRRRTSGRRSAPTTSRRQALSSRPRRTRWRPATRRPPTAKALPVWVGPVAIGALFGVAGVADVPPATDVLTRVRHGGARRGCPGTSTRWPGGSGPSGSPPPRR